MDQKMLPGSVTRRDLLRAAAFVPAGLYAAPVSIAGTADAAALHAFDQHRDHVSRAEALAGRSHPRRGRARVQSLQLLEREPGRSQGDGAGAEGNGSDVRQHRGHRSFGRLDRIHAPAPPTSCSPRSASVWRSRRISARPISSASSDKSRMMCRGTSSAQASSMVSSGPATSRLPAM